MAKITAGKTILLLVDKQAIIGSAVVSEIQKEQSQQQVVFVTGAIFFDQKENVFTLSYSRKLPVIPDGDYSHIMVVYAGEQEILGSLDSLIKKAQETKGRFIFVLPQVLSENKIVNDVLSSYGEAVVVFVGDVFGANSKQQTVVEQFLHQAKTEERLVIEGMGLGKTHPVFVGDVAQGILEVLFGNIGKERRFFLFPKHPPTKLGLARILQKIDPILRIDFVGQEKEEEEKKTKEGKFLLPDSYPLAKRIKEAYESLSLEEKQTLDNTRVRQRIKTIFFFSTYFLFIFFFLLFAATFLFSFAGVKKLEMAIDAVKTGDIPKARESASLASALFVTAQKTATVFSMDMLQDRIKAGKDTAFLIATFIRGLDAFFKEEGEVAVSHFRQALQLWQVMRASGDVPQEAFYLSTEKVTGIIDVLPKLLGFYEDRVYLVLFQNNMELRPGGGFIGSYAIAKLKKGKLLDFSIHDVYDADGQLKGHIEPPFAIRRHLPSVHWYLRDSNFNVDFPKSASASSFFLKTETGTNVDGVIAVDVSFVRLLLSVIGKVEVSDYKETVDAENLYLLTQKHAQENFFPGSNQKKDFLRSLFQAVQMRLSSDKSISYIALLEALVKGIKEKHLLFVFTNQSIQNVFTVNRMSSSLWDAREKQKDDLNDFLGISEVNLGVNKANYFVTRKIKQEVTLTKDLAILEKLTIRYKNNSEDKILGGDYKNYIRLILPLGTKLSEITIDNAPQSIIKAVTDPSVYEGKRFVAPVGLEVEQTQENTKALFGFLLTVPQGKEVTVVVSYELPKKELLNNQFYYNLWLFKQPGTDEYPYEFSISYPDSIKVIKGRVFVKKTISEDELIDVSFAKK